VSVTSTHPSLVLARGLWAVLDSSRLVGPAGKPRRNQVSLNKETGGIVSPALEPPARSSE
jgi:hypothetical protein